MPRAIVWTIGTAAIAVAVIAILSVASRPVPAPVESQAHPATKQPPAGNKTAEATTKDKKDATQEGFIDKAHQDSLDTLVKAIEEEVPKVAMWETLRAGQKAASPYRPFGTLSYQERQRWKHWQRELQEIREERLDQPRKVLKRTASFWVSRVLDASSSQDPLFALRNLFQITEDLQAQWSRLDDALAWQEPVQALADSLAQLAPPKALSPAQDKRQRSLLKTLTRRLARWTSTRAKIGLPDSWASPLAALKNALNAYAKKTRKIPARRAPAELSEEEWMEWTKWELGLVASPRLAQQGIASTRQRLARIQAKVPRKLPRDEKASLPRCEQAVQALHLALDASPHWIERKIDCPRLMALSKPRTRDDMLARIIDWGWVQPTRQEVRRQQRPLIAGLSSQWGPAVHAQMRALMLLASLSDEPWVQLRRARVLTQMQAELCSAQQLLGSLQKDPRRTPTTCPKAPQQKHPADRFAQLKGVRSGAMPTTRAVMAGLDRFYWGPTRVALYWATPKGVDLDLFGRPPGASGPHGPHRTTKATMKPRIQPLFPQ